MKDFLYFTPCFCFRGLTILQMTPLFSSIIVHSSSVKSWLSLLNTIVIPHFQHCTAGCKTFLVKPKNSNNFYFALGFGTRKDTFFTFINIHELTLFAITDWILNFLNWILTSVWNGIAGQCLFSTFLARRIHENS